MTHPAPALSVFLPMSQSLAQVSAQNFAHRKTGFAFGANEGSICPVTHGSVPIRTVTSQYRYPSPIGRSGVPKARPSILFPDFGQAAATRRFFARAQISREHSRAPRVKLAIRINRGVTSRCAEQKSLQLQPLHWAALPPAVKRSGNRPWWAAQPVSAPQLSRAETLAQARLSARALTSLIARRTPAPAAAFADLNTSARAPRGGRNANPRCLAAAGVLHAQMPPLRGQEPGRD